MIIGNGDYADAVLRNPASDARDMAETLMLLGFEVQRHVDLNKKQIHRAIRRFGRALAQSEVGVFYYAGHGMQVNNRNYLIPIGADIETEDEVPYEAVDAGQVLAKMESARNPVNILILDACRNNPLERSFRSSSRGLVRMPSPVGSLVLYATAPGKTAADGRGDRNGVFTKHLMNELRRPGVSLTDVEFNARVAVMKETGNEQVPWSSSSLTRRVILNQIGPLDKSMLPSVSESLKLIIEP
ncbi:MAG: caspase family protein, partial [Gammaproteobacteria bacterium]|nr:caspase family protein [Gammaproteobacteria bacterium]